jgi:hypothetical protein
MKVRERTVSGPIPSHDPTAARRGGRIPSLAPLPPRTAAPTLTKAAQHSIAADARQRTSERQGSAPPVAALSAGPAVDEQKLTATLAEITATAKGQAAAITSSAKELTSGNAVARGFNSVVNFFNHKQDRMESQRQNAVKALTSTLPGDLETFHRMITAAGNDPAKNKAATDFLQKALDRTQSAVDTYNDKATDLSKSNKFWSGIASDTIAGIGVAVGVGLCLTGAGATVGAPLIAASFAGGGALSVGSHALLDNQFSLKREGLSTFVIGGISGVATAVTAGASTAVAGRISAGAAKVFGANAVKGAVVQGAIMATARGVTSGVVGATISGAQQIAEEHATGNQAGAGKRILKAMGTGAVGGFVGGALWSGVSSAIDAAIPSVMNRLPGSLSSSLSKASERVGQSTVGRVAWNTLSGAFYGGPVGAAGTALATWMTGEKMTKEEFWDQVIGGAINGGAVYGAWASTPGGRQDMESPGSYALEKPGRRAPNFRKMQVTVSNLKGSMRGNRSNRTGEGPHQDTGAHHAGGRTTTRHAPATQPTRSPARPKATVKGPRPFTITGVRQRLSTMRQRIAILPTERRRELSDGDLKRLRLDRASLLQDQPAEHAAKSGAQTGSGQHHAG